MKYINKEQVKDYFQKFIKRPEFYTLEDLKDYIEKEQSEYLKDITAPPTDEERNLIYCLSFRDNLTKEEVQILGDRYRYKVQVYNAISSIAQKRGKNVLGVHPFIGEYTKCEEACKHIKEYLKQDTQTQVAGIENFKRKIEEILF